VQPMITKTQRKAQSSRRYCGRSKSGSPGERSGTRVVELRQVHPTAPIHHKHEAADEGDSGHVEHQREHQVELTVPEADSEQRFENVVFQGNRRGCRQNSSMKP